MEDLPEGRTIPTQDRQNPSSRIGAKSRSENVQGQRRIFQISLGCLSAKQGKRKNLNTSCTKLSQKESLPPKVEKSKLPDSETTRLVSNTVNSEMGNQDKTGDVCLSKSSTSNEGISVTLCAENKTSQPFPKASSRGRGRGMSRQRVRAPGDMSKSNRSVCVNELKNSLTGMEKRADDKGNFEQSKPIALMCVPEKGVQPKENSTVAPELPDLIKCQSKQEHESTAKSDIDYEEAYESDYSFVDVDSSEQNTEFSKLSTLVVKSTRQQYQDSSSSDDEQKERRKTNWKHSRARAVEKSLPQNSIREPSLCKPKKSSHHYTAIKDNENPGQNLKNQKTGSGSVMEPTELMFSQKADITYSSKSKEKYLRVREKTNVQHLNKEKAAKDENIILENSEFDGSLFSGNAKMESKETKDAIPLTQYDLNKEEIEKQSKKLECLTSSRSAVHESAKENLADDMREQCNMLSSSVCARVAALYHTFQAENDKEMSSLAMGENSESLKTKPALERTDSTGAQEIRNPENADSNFNDGMGDPSSCGNMDSKANSNADVRTLLKESDCLKLTDESQTNTCSSPVESQEFQTQFESCLQHVKNSKEHKVLETDIQTTKCEMVKDILREKNLQLTKKKEKGVFIREEKNYQKGGGRSYPKNANINNELDLHKCQNVNVSGEHNDKVTGFKTSREKCCQTVGEVSTSDESMCALKLENVSISHLPHRMDDEKHTMSMSKERKYVKKDGTKEKIENQLNKNKNSSSFSEKAINRPEKESLHSSGICLKSLSDYDSEPKLEMDSQSDSEFFIPERKNATSPHAQLQNEYMGDKQEIKCSNFQHHPSVDPIMQGFNEHRTNRFHGYLNHTIPSFSKVFQPVEEMYLPAHELIEHTEQILDFLKFCSEKINQRSSYYQEYRPLDVRIKVDFVHKIPQSCPYDREPELSRISYSSYVDPYIPPGFPHPHLMWPGPEAWSEFQSQHMDASRTDARNFYPPDHSQPRSRPHSARLTGFNPHICSPYHFASYRSLHDSMKRAYEVGPPHSHTASDLSEPPVKVSSAYSSEDGHGTNKQQYPQTERHNYSCEQKNEKERKRNASFSTSRNSATKKAGMPTALGVSAFLTPERLHNAMDKVQRTPVPNAGILQDLKPTLKRTSSNPEVGKERQCELGWDSTQSHQLAAHSKCSAEENFIYSKKQRSVSNLANSLTPRAGVEGSKQAKENGNDEVHGSSRKIDMSARNTLSVHDTLALGSDAPNWRDHCKSLGDSDSSLAPISVQFKGSNKSNWKRRSYQLPEMGGNAVDDAGLPTSTTKVMGLKGRRSDPGFSLQDPAVSRRERWLTSFQHRSRGYQLPFIDTHCHIDFLYSRMGVEYSTPFHKFRAEHHQYFPSNYEGCIAIFCNPKTFSYLNPHNTVLKMVEKEEQVWVALGCHPKNAEEFNSYHLHGLRLALQSPKVVALGEIGLDYSGQFSRSSEIQKSVFIQQLNLALNMKLPLVIHCRDADDDCLDILQKIVPKEHKIHAHCFTRGKAVAQRWMDAFPNLWLGFTPLLSYKSAVDPMEAAAHIPLDRLLLETDAPFFVPGSLRDASVHFSYPGFALITAEEIAFQKGIPVADVLKACRQNTKDMYGV